MPGQNSTIRLAPTDSITVRVFRELLRTYGLVERVMQPYFGRFGISGSQWGLLRNLHRAEQEGHSGLRLSALSDRLLIRPPSVTGAVDRLERLRLVVRTSDPTDQRAKSVRLTPAGRKLVETVLRAHEQQIENVLSGLSVGDQAHLHRLLTRLGRHLEGLANQNPLSLHE